MSVCTHTTIVIGEDDLIGLPLVFATWIHSKLPLLFLHLSGTTLHFPILLIDKIFLVTSQYILVHSMLWDIPYYFIKQKSEVN